MAAAIKLVAVPNWPALAASHRNRGLLPHHMPDEGFGEICRLLPNRHLLSSLRCCDPHGTGPRKSCCVSNPDLSHCTKKCSTWGLRYAFLLYETRRM
jgi:hypothetical protein